MGIVGVPMIYRDPVQPCIEITFGIGHQFAGKGAKVGHLGRVLRRHREAEMMPIILAPLREGLAVGIVRDSASNIRASAPSRVTPSRLRYATCFASGAERNRLP